MAAAKGDENNSVKRPRGDFPSSLCSISSVVCFISTPSCYARPLAVFALPRLFNALQLGIKFQLGREGGRATCTAALLVTHLLIERINSAVQTRRESTYADE